MKSAAILLATVSLAPLAAKDYLVYVGTYTRDGKSKGIYAYRFEDQIGKLTPIGLAAETPNPSFLTIHPNKRWLYSVSEMGGGTSEGGAVSAFAIDSTSGKLTFLNKVSSRGAGPCFVSVDKTGKNLLVANYNSGSIASLPIQGGGGLGEATGFVQHSGSSVNKARQAGPHAHSINLSPDNRFAIVGDLGLDQVLVYRFDAAKGTLTPNDPPFTKVAPGSGPRHFTFHPGGKFAYVINEIASTVTAFNWNAGRGALTEIQTISTLPQGWKGDTTTAEVLAHPNGKFLYGSNRGHDSITVFTIDKNSGKLTYVENAPTNGKTPRNFRIDPSGGWLFAENQATSNVQVFRIDQKTGRLSPSGDPFEAPSPVCIKFLDLKSTTKSGGPDLQ